MFASMVIVGFCRVPPSVWKSFTWAHPYPRSFTQDVASSKPNVGCNRYVQVNMLLHASMLLDTTGSMPFSKKIILWLLLKERSFMCTEINYYTQCIKKTLYKKKIKQTNHMVKNVSSYCKCLYIYIYIYCLISCLTLYMLLWNKNLPLHLVFIFFTK